MLIACCAQRTLPTTLTNYRQSQLQSRSALILPTLTSCLQHESAPQQLPDLVEHVCLNGVNW